ncbi:hypothetical protein IFM89_039128 [Coptis chinensis]|uniref:Zinc knuckle CX2CX4HX4C domain-containing protein n=1 Tax=Coptis chinensis TaxID=261450 RepID=A0A835IIQ0_9MAGN|nr:hypothetical protein IFM89_039128 [Coptis chinensis]
MDLYELENPCKASQDNIQARQEVNTGKDAALPLISTTTAKTSEQEKRRDFGFYASVLIEIDLAKPIPQQFEVEEEEGKTFLQDVDVGKLPKFCPHCKVVGHIMAECSVMRRSREKEGSHNHTEATGKGKRKLGPKRRTSEERKK